MKKNVVAVVVAVVAVFSLAAVVALSRESPTSPEPESMSMPSNGTSDQGRSGDSIINSGNDGASEAVEASSVDIQDFSYQPEKIIIKKGTTVTWTNQDSARHDVTPDQPSADFEASELLAQGESYSFTFNTVGTYSYFCSPHPYMKGVVEVVE